MRIRNWAVAALVSLLVTLCGCGDSTDEKGGSSASSAKDNGVASKRPNQIVEDAAAALRRTRSVRMQGTATIDGKRTAVKIDLQGPKDFRAAFRQKTTSAELVLLKDSVYIKANEAFFREQGAGRQAPDIADEWLEVPGSAAELREITKGVDIATLSRCLADPDFHGSLSVAGKQKVNGQPAVVIVDRGDRPGTAPSKLFVATTGEPLPLRATTTGRQRQGGKRDADCNDPSSRARPGDEITFSRYNEDLNIKAPAGARSLAPGTAS